MSSLILKDIYIQLRYIGLIVIIYTIFTVVPGMPGEVFLSVGVVMTAFRLAYLEDKNNTIGLLRTMPLKPAAIVFSKFIAQALIGGFFVLISAVHLSGVTGRGAEAFFASLAAVSVTLLFAGAIFALSFRFGYLKASTYVRILFFTFFLPFFIPGVQEKMNLGIMWFQEHVPLTWVTALVAELAVLIVYLGIAGLAVWLWERGDVER